MPESVEAYLRRLLGDVDDGMMTDITPADEELLPQLAEEALQGVDIRRQYPALWLRLSTQRQLRETFLDLVAMLETIREADDTPYEMAVEALEQLHRLPPVAQHRQMGRDRWQVAWRHTPAQLAYLLNPPSPPQVTYRRALDAPAGRKLALFRTQAGVPVETGTLNVFWELEEPADSLFYNLQVLVSFEPQPGFTTAPRLQATLIWGDYHQTLPLTQDAATFTAIPRAAIAATGFDLRRLAETSASSVEPLTPKRGFFHPLEITIATVEED